MVENRWWAEHSSRELLGAVIIQLGRDVGQELVDGEEAAKESVNHKQGHQAAHPAGHERRAICRRARHGSEKQQQETALKAAFSCDRRSRCQKDRSVSSVLAQHPAVARGPNPIPQT